MDDPAPSVMVNISCRDACSLWGHLFFLNLSQASTQTVQKIPGHFMSACIVLI